MNSMPADLPDDCARLLAFQHGVIARWQAQAAGLSPAVIDAQLRCGRWRPLYRGVYAAYTGVPPRECVLWARRAARRAGAVLSHHSAAELDGLTDRRSPVTHVTVGIDRRVRVADDERRGPTPRIVVHRAERLDAIRHPPGRRRGPALRRRSSISPRSARTSTMRSRGCAGVAAAGWRPRSTSRRR